MQTEYKTKRKPKPYNVILNYGYLGAAQHELWWRQAVSPRWWRQAVSLCWWRQAVSLSDVVIEPILFEAANALGNVLGVKIHGAVHLQDREACASSS